MATPLRNEGANQRVDWFFGFARGVDRTIDGGSGPVHLIDGDGASLCNAVSAANLVPIGYETVTTVDPERRCSCCDFIVPR